MEKGLMKIVIAPDSFKECLSAPEVAEAMARGARRALPGAEIDLVPMADGGEGTVEALTAATGGEFVDVAVKGPMGEDVTARYGLLDGGRTAVVEMAAASGLALVPKEKRNPRRACTYGTGELMRDALERGARKIIVGIGGSATNDCGAGMARALGYSLRDERGGELPPGGAALKDLEVVDGSGKNPLLEKCEILAACDVKNPLCGPNGASRIYGPQKGADAEAVRLLDEALRRCGEAIEAQLGAAVLDLQGGGAAGGLGAGLVGFAGGHLRPGVEIVAEACGLAERIRGADLVLTGEGRLDGQSAEGKTPVGVARIARDLGVPVVALAGALGEGYEKCYAEGITAAFSICSRPMSLDEAIAEAENLLAQAAEGIVRRFG